MQRLLQEVWEHAVYQDAVRLRLMRKLSGLNLADIHSTREITFLLMVLQVRFIRVMWQQESLRLAETLVESWLLLISTESLV